MENHRLVETVDTPDNAYRPDRLFDMEAAGIFSAAVPVLGTAGVQCLKILSDGPDSPIKAIDKQAVSSLIENQLTNVDAMVDHLLARQEPARAHRDRVNTALQELVNATARHSTSERHRLHSLLSRQLALHGTLPTPGALGTPTSAAALAASLQVLVDAPAASKNKI